MRSPTMRALLVPAVANLLASACMVPTGIVGSNGQVVSVRPQAAQATSSGAPQLRFGLVDAGGSGGLKASFYVPELKRRGLLADVTEGESGVDVILRMTFHFWWGMTGGLSVDAVSAYDNAVLLRYQVQEASPPRDTDAAARNQLTTEPDTGVNYYRMSIASPNEYSL